MPRKAARRKPCTLRSRARNPRWRARARTTQAHVTAMQKSWRRCWVRITRTRCGAASRSSKKAHNVVAAATRCAFSLTARPSGADSLPPCGRPAISPHRNQRFKLRADGHMPCSAMIAVGRPHDETSHTPHDSVPSHHIWRLPDSGMPAVVAEQSTDGRAVAASIHHRTDGVETPSK